MIYYYIAIHHVFSSLSTQKEIKMMEENTLLVQRISELERQVDIVTKENEKFMHGWLSMFVLCKTKRWILM